MAGRKGSHVMNAKRCQGRILLVEDETLIGLLVAEALGDDGFEVHSVGSAEEALDALSAGLKVDLLFTDINLPAMDGTALADQVRKLYPGLPVVYASARWSMLDRLRALPRCAVLPKPYSLTRACLAVAHLLGAEQRTAAAG
jgi:CheY-like chemotaxis protein